MAMTAQDFRQEIKISLAEKYGVDVDDIKDTDIVGFKKISLAYERANQLTGQNIQPPKQKQMRVGALIDDICETFEVSD